MAQRGRGAAAGPRPAARRADLVALRARLRAVVEPIVTAADLDLEDLAVAQAGRRHVVRVTVDGDGGVSHNDLSVIAQHLSAGLDAAEESGGELTPDSYTLEVSSPGVDRPLTLPRHWRRNAGRLVVVRALGRNITARIAAADEAGVTLGEGADRVTLPYHELGPGRVQVEFARLDGGDDRDEGDEGDEAEEDDGDDGDDHDGHGQAEREGRA